MEEFERNLKFIDSRYETRLLWRLDKNKLSDNYEIAKCRFMNLLKRLKSDSWLNEKYNEIIEEQLKGGIAEECNIINENNNNGSYYMPHTSIVKKYRTSSKVRIVFDASSKAENCYSLNELLATGENLNPNILTVLLKFREHAIAFSGDIEQAFLQIKIEDSERRYLRFFWVNDGENLQEDSLRVLQMARLPFGLTVSPFILAGTIKHHIGKYKEQNYEAYDMLNNFLYVDDLIFGANSVKEAFSLTSDAKKILGDASMNLRKFKSNSNQLKNLWVKNGMMIDGETSDERSQKILGLIWDTETDVLKIDLQPLLENLNDIKCTKRYILKTVSRIFDPAGYLAAFVIRIKVLLQEIWELGTDWDDQLPEKIKEKWFRWCSEVEILKHLSINRRYISTENLAIEEATFYIFCDASMVAYGAVAYIKHGVEGKIETRLVMAKSRVAPLKRLTLPRLELMGAVIGARIAKYLTDIFHISSSRIFLFTDSNIVLCWIKGSAKQYKQFVSNRIVEIQTLTDPQCWKHCRGKQNPADFITRGESAENLLKNSMWWTGGPVLTQNNEQWLTSPIIEPDEEVNEEKRTNLPVSMFSCVTSTNSDSLINLNNYSSILKVYRITAYIMRFVTNIKVQNRRNGELSADEIWEAEKFWIVQTQKEAFPNEYYNLTKNKSLPQESNILQLNPILNLDKIICISGRLQNSNFETFEKQPILLPTKHRFTELTVKYCHERVMHSGVADTLSHLREKFWVPRGRQVTKKIIASCFVCRRYKAKPASQVTAPLPYDRIHETPVFETIGCDFAGPLYLKDSNSKCYITLFTCATTRAIHLELVTDLSTKSFILALKRFISRRGLCKIIYSDNAKTFKSANKELIELWKTINHQDVAAFYGKHGIKWKYIIERAAWWGGMWERLVRSIKTCLKKTLGKTSLNYQELETVLIEVEATVNSRPLTYVYSEPDEPSPLTPAHFIIGKTILSLPTHSNFREKPSSKTELLKLYQYRQRLLDHLWTRWRKEYLLMLRSAHHTPKIKGIKELKVGDIVLLGEDKTPRNVWKTGKVLEVFEGRDGKVRSCLIKLPSGTLKRPIQLLFPLELDVSAV